MSLIKFCKKYIRGTASKAPVIELSILLCNLTKTVQKVCKLETQKVHVTTKVLKHLYDSKPAEEFDFIIRHVFKLIKYPDQIYENKSSKRGDLCFVKTIKCEKYIASIEVFIEISENGKDVEVNYAVTAFRIRKDNYLKNYKLLWSWKGDNPSS